MTCILLVIIASLMTYVSQLREEVIQINKKLDKVIKHLGIENYSNIDDELRDIILERRGKIKAIKRYREHTGLGLKESKEYIDNLCEK
ncbi:ribosomal protein L7/L12 [Clostridium sp. DSM 100503]|uniref:ribosomal protein L7/L12 n=1 Tax=Clostridium sp. DSM 100503 TaxID=2963282 RepID=UPI00214A4B4B|nr:ribosomal protein L7/L12 [Clostridium sp. DSM 100503]MCR1952004.1 ribosomal protein L7/L12 [Clostridium sp. DSM 100503]